MKKLLIVISFLCIIALSAGCLRPTISYTPKETAESTTETTAPNGQITYEQKPMYAVSVPTVTECETASDGTVLFEYTYQNISLIHPEPEVADKVIVDFLNRIDQTASSAESIRAAAKAAYAPGTAWTPYMAQITYSPMRIDNGVLSFLGSYSSYSGSSHPEHSYLSVSYDLITGNALSLSDILTEKADANTLVDLITQSLEGNDQLYGHFKDVIKDRFQHGYENDTFWYFSTNGLQFYFSPYEIAPYSAGLIVAEIPYDKLPGVLDDAYFPAELDAVAGELSVTKFDNTAENTFTQFAEVILDESGEMILLHSDIPVCNLRLETGLWNDDATVFLVKNTVFAAYMLTPGDAVMIQSVFGEVMPEHKLTYDSAGKTVSRYILLSGKDGSPILTEQ